MTEAKIRGYLITHNVQMHQISGVSRILTACFNDYFVEIFLYLTLFFKYSTPGASKKFSATFI